MSTYNWSEGKRLAQLDATVTELTEAPKLLGSFGCSPNAGFTYGAIADVAFTLRFVECDKEDGQILGTTDVAVTTAGYLGEYLPACNLVKVYAFVASGSAAVKLRLFEKGVQ